MLKEIARVDLKYASLLGVLLRALWRASDGKGKERHATEEPFENQQICQLARRFGPGAMLAQVVKKCNEVPVLEGMENGRQRAINEILDAIVYAAVAVIALDVKKDG